MSNWNSCWVINVKNPLDCWLIDDCVYEQMTLEKFLKEGNQ